MKILFPVLGLMALCSFAVAQTPMQHSARPMLVVQRHRPGPGVDWRQIHILENRIEALRRENARLNRQLWAHGHGRNPSLRRRIDMNNREINRLQRQINDLRRGRR